jgi:hypothetical protein
VTRPGTLGNLLAIIALAVAISILGDFIKVAVQPASAATGRVNGLLEFRCGEVPIAEDLDVLPTGGDSLDQDIARAFGEELTRQRYRVAPGAGLIIAIDAMREEGRLDRLPGSLGKIKAGKGGLEMQMNLWSSGEDSLLARRERQYERQEPKLIIVATLRDRQSSKIFWRGRASGPIGNASPRSIGLALVPPLVSAFGCPVMIDDISLPAR